MDRASLDWLTLDPAGGQAKASRLRDVLREEILAGRLAPGTVLPPTRRLAKQLEVSRNTVVTAYDMLAAEDLVAGRAGAATRVLSPSPAFEAEPPADRSWRPRPFEPGLPALDAFPYERWSRCLGRRSRQTAARLGDPYEQPGGYPPLRRAIAAYLQSARKVDCRPEEVVVVASGRAGLSLLAELLVAPGSSVAVEDPGYLTARRAFRAAGRPLVPVPVDGAGLRVDALAGLGPAPKLMHVTPTHQWPLGVQLSAARRAELLAWATRWDAWIVEDDYDAEFQFDGRRAPALKAEDGQGRVVLVGTFAKTMLPGLRVAYVVARPDLAGWLAEQAFCRGHEPAQALQAALADFMDEGDFARHLRRMRGLYARRRDRLLGALRQLLGATGDLPRPPGGLQMAMPLPHDLPADAIALGAERRGVEARTLGFYALDRSDINGLHLGFAAVPEAALLPATKKKLVQAIDDAV